MTTTIRILEVFRVVDSLVRVKKVWTSMNVLDSVVGCPFIRHDDRSGAYEPSNKRDECSRVPSFHNDGEACSETTFVSTKDPTNHVYLERIVTVRFQSLHSPKDPAAVYSVTSL